MNQNYAKDAKMFKALSDEKRLCILEQLQSGEKCACTLIDELSIAQSALSYHMKILCESGIVSSRQDGKWTHYQLSLEGKNYAIQRLSELISPHTLQNKGCK